MKYLFAAIDARQARLRESQKSFGNSRPARQKYNSLELKRLVIEASEAVDDKSAANDFQDTLERIVNEIKNTTEHSGPFLQKVRKADVPDYYDVIKRPMDLATLLKKVRQQSYRTKKAFSEDLDLIWSNCLLYNSHPDHPLRVNAQALREKSHQLLEFITDPVMNQRNLLAASLGPLDRRSGSFIAGTPDYDDGDADAESDDERSRRGASERVFHGLNGDARDSSASPAPSRSQTPGNVDRRASRKLSRGPLGRISASPEPPAPAEIPFEERPALIRTAHTMNDFLVLEAELSRLERSDFKPVPTSAILPPSDLSTSPATSKSKPSATEGKNRVAALIRSLNPTVLPALPSPSQPNGDSHHIESPTSSSSQSQSSHLKTAPGTLRDPSEPVESLWWDLVASTSVSSQLFPHCPESASLPPVNGKVNGHSTDHHRPRPQRSPTEEVPIAALAAGVPRIPWVGYRATPYTSTSTGVLSNGKGKGKAVANGVEPKRKKAKKAKNGGDTGLAVKMKKNCDTLRRIRKEGDRLMRESQVGDFSELPALSADESDEEVPHLGPSDENDEPVRPRPRKRARFAGPSPPKSAFRSPATAPTAAREGLRGATAGVLDHAGFEGSSGMALDVLTHAAAEYISNLGRTLRFYSDRFGSEMSKEQMLLNTLSESGIPSPSTLHDYVSDDINQYGARLSDLLGKLERSRQERLNTLTPEDEKKVEEADQVIDADDGEALIRGEIASWTGEDFFGIAQTGLDVELGVSSLIVPKRVFRGDTSLPSELSNSAVPYAPPPPFSPLTAEAIPSQIGLLQPFFTQRQTTEYGLTEDALLPNRPKTTRHKVPLNGKIPYKSSRPRPTDPTLPASMQVVNDPPKRKKKKDKAAKLAT
ncbi:hypothetical protein JCM3765_002680 [Sporobolomyces pararoseus]